MSNQNHDAAAQPATPPPPPHSYARRSTPSSRAFIDLSSPPRLASVPQRAADAEAEAADPRPRPGTARKSDDELRLVGDFSTPADAVACPDPQSWNPSSHMRPQTSMKNKPGARESYRPIDTLTERASEPTRPRQITDAKQNCPMPQTIGRAQHGGQQAYRMLTESRTHTSSAPARLPHAAQTDRARGPSLAKRRKTEHVIELDGDDELERMSPSHTHYTPGRTVHAMQPAGSRSQSQVSVGSGRSCTASRQSAQPQSEFRATDQRKSHRKPRRHGPAKGQGFQIPSPVGKGTATRPNQGTVQGGCVTLSDDEAAVPRRFLLDEIQQGIEEPSPRRAIATTKHFPNARINESTSDFPEPSKGIQSEHFISSNLRDKFRPPPLETEDVDDSPDELAMSHTQVPVAKSKVVPSSKAVQAANSGVKRKNRTVSAGESGWQLSFARSLDFTYRGPGLRLRHGTDKTFVIQILDNDHNYCHGGNLDLCRFSKVDADDTSRIRLTGSRGPDGNIPTIDMEFGDTEGFIHFRDKHAVPHSHLGKFFQHDQKHMQSMFERAPPKNTKVGHSSGVADIEDLNVLHSATKPQHFSEKNALMSQLRTYAKSPKRTALEGVAATKALPRPTRTSARPTRSSAVSATLFDVESNDYQEVEKYSVKHGLGPPWKKPLEYGQGKQRATVHFADLSRLDEEEYLNDSLIDFYMIHLFKQHRVPSDKVYFFNTYFYTALTKETGRNSMNYARVARWTQKIDVFGYEYIVVPINEATHWYLAIICNVSNIDRKPVLEDFDDKTSTTVGKQHSDPHQDMPREQVSLAGGRSSPLLSHDPAQPFEEAANEPSSQNVEDVNLFEESSQLNLVDPHDSGLRTEESTTDGGAFHSPKHDAGHSTFVSEKETRSSLETLTASQKSKKQKKRQHVPPKKDPNQPIIIILDSLCQTRSGAVRALKDWISAEGETKRGMDAVIKEKGHYPKASQIPTQSNWSDCGVYLLGYVDKFFQDPDDFKNKLLAGDMSAERDWPDLDPKQMRNHMRETIFECMKEQDTAMSRERKAKLRTAKKNALPPNNKAQEERTPTPVNTELQILASAGVEPSKTSEPSTQDTSPRKLASPFELKPTSIEVSDQKPLAQASRNGSHMPPVPASPAKSTASIPSVERVPRRRSPEVRIASKSPEKSRAGQAKVAETLPPIGEILRLRQQPNLLGFSHKIRRNENGSQPTLAASERNSGMLLGKQGASRSTRSSPSSRSNGESSTPNIPGKTPDSQDPRPETLVSPEHMPTKLSAKSQAAAESLPTRCMLRAAPSLEEINPSSFYAEHARKRRHNQVVSASDSVGTGGGEQDSRVLTPILMDGLVQRAEEAFPDVMDIDSPSADAMEMDSISRGSEVEETPERDEGHFSSVDRERSPLLM